MPRACPVPAAAAPCAALRVLQPTSTTLRSTYNSALRDRTASPRPPATNFVINIFTVGKGSFVLRQHVCATTDVDVTWTSRGPLPQAARTSRAHNEETQLDREPYRNHAIDAQPPPNGRGPPWILQPAAEGGNSLQDG
jgi:hypothetical protein